jgi:hypothetical protein
MHCVPLSNRVAKTRQRVRDAAERLLAELKRLYEASGDQTTASVIAEAEPRFEPPGNRRAAQLEHTAQVGTRAPGRRTTGNLLRAFKDDAASNYGKRNTARGETYDSLLRTIEADIGAL